MTDAKTESSKTKRTFFVGGNWKSFGSKKSVETLVAGLNKGTVPSSVDVIVAPVFIHLPYVQQHISSSFHVAAQNCSQYNDGAFTGEVSAAQLRDLGLNWVIVGHSERRKLFGETDKVVQEKVAMALKAGLRVIACLGETLEERKADQTLTVVNRQLEAIAASAISDWSRVVIAYEPVWAIGTGVVASPEQAQEVHAALRSSLRKLANDHVAQSTRIIYGGSVKPDNCDQLSSKSDVDGFLVGGASLVADDFIKIINAKGKTSS